MGEVWERIEGEPIGSFNRFTVYRDLGPGRSLRKAYAKYHGIDWRRVGKTKCMYWRYLSAHWNWVERAKQFDTVVLALEGRRSIEHFLHGLEAVSEKTDNALANLPNVQPATWREALEGLDLVGSFIPVETIKQAILGTLDSPAPAADPSAAPDPDA